MDSSDNQLSQLIYMRDGNTWFHQTYFVPLAREMGIFINTNSMNQAGVISPKEVNNKMHSGFLVGLFFSAPSGKIWIKGDPLIFKDCKEF